MEKGHYQYTTKDIKKELLSYIEKNYTTNNEIKSFCDDVIKKKQLEMMSNPKVYLAKTKDIKTDIYYLNCKLSLPIGLNKFKEIKVYVGKMSNFPNGTKDENAIRIGKNKIKEKIKEIMDNPSLTATE